MFEGQRGNWMNEFSFYNVGPGDRTQDYQDWLWTPFPAEPSHQPYPYSGFCQINSKIPNSGIEEVCQFVNVESPRKRNPHWGSASIKLAWRCFYWGGDFLIHDGCRGTSPNAGSDTPGQLVLGYIRKQVECATKNKPVSSVLLFFHFPAPSSSPGVIWWETLTCRVNLKSCKICRL